MKIVITGDTHGEVVERISKRKQSKGLFPKLESGDFVFILGDAGIGWRGKKDGGVRYLDNYLKQQGLTVFSVLGNHENYDFIESHEIVEIYGGRCYKITDRIFYFLNGETFDFYGEKFAVFGGALSIDKQYRKKGITWWEQEQVKESVKDSFIKKLSQVNTKEYILLSHTTEYEEIKKLLWSTSPKLDRTSNYLQEIKFHFDFKTHYFGHFHENISLKNSFLLYDKGVEIPLKV